jgi:hypothetical protein
VVGDQRSVLELITDHRSLTSDHWSTPFHSLSNSSAQTCRRTCYVLAITREASMSIVDDLIENLVERNVIQLNGTLNVSLVDGGVKVKGTLLSTVADQKKNKNLLNVNIPVDADVKVGEIIVPLPAIK